jgi:predicted permease
MPDWKAAVHDRIRSLGLEPTREADIVEELATHLEERHRELLASGLSAAKAERLAIEELENHDALATRLRRTRQPVAHEPVSIGSESAGSVIRSVWLDCKVAARMMKQRPGFTLAVLGMLAVGVAGNAAIFSIFNGLFLRPLPFSEGDRLVDLDEKAPKWNLDRVSISNPDYAAWIKGNRTFESMAFYNSGGANLVTDDGTVMRIKTASVTSGLLNVFRLKLAAGRDIQPEEDRPKGNNVILLSYDLWQRLYHGDRAAMGKVLRLSETPFTIIGVLPREAMIPTDTDAWIPLAADTTKGGSFYLSGVGRLKSGVTLSQATADLSRVHWAAPGNEGRVTTPIVGSLRDRFLGDYRVVMKILLGTVAVVLLIACVNIAGLMLVRGESRSRELAIRTAVGASRWRIARQLLAESFAVAAAGGILGIALGKAFLAGLVSLMPDTLPKWVRFDLDWRFGVFCIAVTGFSAILFGLAPALQAANVDTRNWLQQTARTTMSRGKRATLSALVVGEIALALLLLASSGLLLQAFRKVMTLDPGFRPDDVVTFTLRPPEVRLKKPEEWLSFYTNLLDRLRTIPGAESVSAATIVPMDGHNGYFFRVDGGRQLADNDPSPVVLGIVAMPGYLKTMGMTLVSGREFDNRDTDLKATKTALVNETFARYFWGTTDVVGKRLKYPGGNQPWFQVIGVFHDMRHYGLDKEVRPEVMLSFASLPSRGFTVVIRGAGDPNLLAAPAREELRKLDPALPTYNVKTMNERLSRSLWVRRAYSWLFAAFAAVAILLAAAGVYGVIAFAVSQRTREIGIRMALGARPGQVLRGVLLQGMALVTIGVVLGLAASQFTAGLLKSLLFGVSPRDLATYSLVIAGVVIVGLAANFVPARRAAGIEPVTALRSD